MSTFPNTPEDYIEQWKKMNEEFIEDGLPFIIKIPTLEEIQQWMKRDEL